MKVVLTGGGTGGHVYPLLAIAESLGYGQYFYFGTKKGAESRMVKGMKFITIPAVAFPTSSRDILGFLKFSVLLPVAVIKSFFKLRKIKPDVVISSGGYVSVPVIIAARILSIPVVLHEQNLVPGRANKLLSKYASAIGVSFKETKNLLSGKVFFTGYPLRKRIKRIDKELAREKLGIDRKARVILVTGGSRGAKSINEAIVKVAPVLLNRGYWIIHSTGIGTRDYRAFDETKRLLEKEGLNRDKRYILREYINEMEVAYSASDLIVCRAGAGTVEEIKQLRIPTIFVPKLGLPGEHQLSNVLPLKKAGVAEIAFEDYLSGLSPSVLLRTIERVEQKLDEMKKRFSLLEEEKPEISITDLVRKFLFPIKKKRKNFFLVFEGEKHPLIFGRNVISSSPFSSIRIKDLSKKIVFSVKGDRGYIEGYGELKGEKIIEIDGKTLIFREEEQEEEIERERSFKGRFASSAGGILTSRIFGFLREIFIGGYFGASLATDIFAVALMISSFFRRVVAENAMDSAFLPTFLRVKKRGGDHWKLAYSVLFLFLLFATGIVVILEATIPGWFHFIAPGFVRKGVLHEGIALTRVMLPYLILVTAAGWASSILKASDRFARAEASSSLYSLGIIISIVFFASRMGIFSLGAGVILGGILQLAFLFRFLFSRETENILGKMSKFSVSLQGAVWVVALLTLPILFDVSFSKLSDIVDKILATPLENGAVAALYFAAIIFRLPVNVIGNSINNVVLKDFSMRLAERNKKGALSVLYRGFELQFVTLLPATLFVFAFSVPLVRLIYMRGAFDERSVLMTSAALSFYSISIIAWGLSSMAGKVFASRLETHISMLTNAATITLNVILSIVLVKTTLGFRGLALATSLSLYFGAILRYFILERRMKKDGISVNWNRILNSFFKWLLASIISVGSGLAFFRLLKGIKLISPFVSLLFSFSLSLILAIVFFALFYFITRPMEKKEKSNGISPLLLPPTKMVEVIAKNPEPYREEMELRTEALLKSPSWHMRNVGVKLVGIYRFEQFRQIINKTLIEDKIGFIRRNAALSLANLPPTQESLGALMAGCRDNYYEVRAACARALGIYGISTEEVRETLYEMLKDKYFEVKKQAIVSISLLFGKEIIPEIRKFYSHSNYEIRMACAKALENLLKRGEISEETAAREAALILDASEGFKPVFPIREIISRLRGRK